MAKSDTSARKGDPAANPAYMACASCANPVHHMSRTCKLCGAESPWIAVKAAKAAADLAQDGKKSEPLGAGQATPSPEPARKPAGAFSPAPATPAPGATIPAATARPAEPEEALAAARPSTFSASGPWAPPASVTVLPAVEAHPPHVFLRDHKTTIGDVFCPFKAGKVVTDHMLITALLAQGAPIVSTVRAEGYVSCPNCGSTFAVPKKAGRASA